MYMCTSAPWLGMEVPFFFSLSLLSFPFSQFLFPASHFRCLFLFFSCAPFTLCVALHRKGSLRPRPSLFLLSLHLLRPVCFHPFVLRVIDSFILA
jgi:hypothetical protein